MFLDPTLENAKLQCRVVSWRWLETCKADSSWASDQQRMNTEFCSEGDEQPGKNFQQGPVLESTQGAEGRWARKGSLEAGISGWRLL